MRLIATEEAFATQEYFDEYLKLAEVQDTPATRYLKKYYRGPLVRQLSDFEARLADMDANGVDMHLLSFTAPGVQAFDASLGSDMGRTGERTLGERHPRTSDTFRGPRHRGAAIARARRPGSKANHDRYASQRHHHQFAHPGRVSG